ncbi:ESX-1 secretion-associated protein [Actinoallomurus purpureus]|uniref:type VII secretion target n=1 Tax=Actinoallomurus purpureus TaxID=478114 RepID=UPI0020920720|nr:type VII secretion target [Actinoallomurus purpureus]MCO6011601.1 ESX-1 secretion-associated protein [Actinoallomurus purpureus]
MGEELRFEPESLHTSGQNVQQVGEDMDTDWQAMQATADGMGDIFGDDMVGSLIAATYQAAHQIAGDTYTSSSKGLTDFGDGLKTMSGNYQATETKTVQDVDNTGKAV